MKPTTTPFHPTHCLLAATLAGALLSLPALAADKHWGGSSTGDWTTGAWYTDATLSTPTTPPVAGDILYINGGRVTIAAGETVASAASNFGSAAGASGTLTVAGLWNTTGNITIGNVANAGGLLELTGTINATGAGRIGYIANSTGTAIVSDYGQWLNSNDLHIGHNGAGFLEITTYATATSRNANVGGGSTGNGTALVSGLWRAGAALTVGNQGAGYLRIRDTGTVTAGITTIGVATNSSGTVIVDGLLSMTGMLSIGGTNNSGAAHGTLIIGESGTVLSYGGQSSYGGLDSTSSIIVNGYWESIDTYIMLGRFGDSTLTIGEHGTVKSGSYFYFGNGSATASTGRTEGYIHGLLETKTHIYVGNNNIGYMYIGATGTAIASTGNGILGNAATSVGSADIHGLWRNAGNLTVGATGTGSLNIWGTGTVTNNHGIIGSAATTGSGTVSVAGLWQNTGSLTIGASGKGELTIETTGTVTSANSAIAAAASSSGLVNVRGLWKSSALTVGGLGNGYLRIHDTGTVTASTINIGVATNSSGTVIVDGLLSMTGMLSIGGTNNSGAAHGTLIIGESGTVLSYGGQSSYGGLNSTSTIIVNGYWESIDTYIMLGRSGDSTLTIGEHGTVKSGSYFYFGNGSETISTGRTEGYIHGLLEAKANIYVGNNNIGYMYIGATGTAIATTGNGVLGVAATGAGTADIHGLWRNGGNLIIGNAGSGALTIWSTGAVTATGTTIIASAASSTGILILDGGLLETRQLALGSGAATFTFNSGTIRANADTDDFFKNFTTLDLATNTLNLDTQTFAITATNTFTGDGVLEKLGTGTLALTADNSATFAGTLNVRAGTLLLASPDAKLGGALNIHSGATLDLLAAPLAATGNVTFANGAIWNYSLADQYALSVSGNLDFAGAGTLFLDRGALEYGDLFPASYTLATYNTITGLSNLDLWTLIGADFSVTHSFDTTTVPGSLILNISNAGVDFLRWQGGDGTWNATDTTWRSSGSPVPWSFAAGAIFGAETAAGTVTVEGLQTFATLQFDTTGYTLDGTGTLTAGSTAGIATTAGATATINTTLNAPNLQKVGAGTLVLGGLTTITDTTSIDAGTIEITGTLSNPGTLDIASATDAALTIKTGGHVNQTGQIALGSAPAATGSLRIENGATLASNNTHIGAAAGSTGAATIAGLWRNTGNLAIGHEGDGSLSILSTGTLTTGGIITIATAAAGTGTLTLDGGLLETRQIARGDGSATLVLNSGTIRATAAATDFFSNLSTIDLASGAISLDTQAFSLTATNALASAATATLDKFGSGTLTLTADSSAYAGTLNIHAGSLHLASPNAKLGGTLNIHTGATLRPTATGATVGTLTISNGATLDLLTAPLSATGDVTFADGANWRYSLDSAHALDIAGALNFAGTGTLFLDRGLIPDLNIPGAYTLASFNTITGLSNLDLWTLVGSDFIIANPAFTTTAVPGSLVLTIGLSDGLYYWQGGDGAWNATNTTWRLDNTPTAWDPGAVGIFASGSGTVTITGLQDFSTLQFDTNGYTLAGTGTLTSTGTANINTTTATATTTIATAFNAPALYKAGPGTLHLAAPATFDGQAAIDSGALQISSTLATAGATIGIDAGDTATVTVATGGHWRNTGTIYLGSHGNGTLNIATGATGTFSALYVADKAGSTGSITIADGGYLYTGSYFYLGGNGAGSLHIENGGTLGIASSFRIGGYNTDIPGYTAGNGYMLVEGLLNGASQTIAVGYNGTGRVDLAATGTILNNDVYIADHATASGTINIWGLWQSARHVYIANAGAQGPGSAVLNIHDSGRFLSTNTSGTFFIGRGANALGEVNIGSGGLLQVAGMMAIGDGGKGILTIETGGTLRTLSTTAQRLGATATGSGAVIIQPGAVWDANSGISVGYLGAGYLEIQDGGVLNSGATTHVGAYGTGTLNILAGGHLHLTNGNSLYVAYYAGNSNGSLIIGGSVTNVGTFYVLGDSSGTAFLHIREGGHLDVSGNARFGPTAGAANGTAIALVEGYWSNTGYLRIGENGASTLTIGATGHIDVVRYSYLGVNEGSSGTAFVQGKWTMGENLEIGNTAGTGYVHIQQGGLVTANHGRLGVGAPTQGTLIVDGLLQLRGNINNGETGLASLTIGKTGTITAGGAFSQNERSTLTIELDPSRTPDTYNPELTSPYITANGAATLSGTLIVRGPGISLINYTGGGGGKASQLSGIPIIRAEGGISGDFDVRIQGATDPDDLPDYIRGGGMKINEGASYDTRYDVGYGLAWKSSPDNAHGTFTVKDGVTFEVDTHLSDRNDITNPAWDGKSLTKSGPGTLILSVENAYTGATTITAGTLRFAGPPSVTIGSLVNNSTVDLGGTGNRTLTATSLAGTGTYRMTVDIAAGANDRLVITGDATGHHHLLLSGIGAMPTGDEPMPTLVTIGGVNNITHDATFLGGFDHGLFNYEVQMIGHQILIVNTGLQPAAFTPIRGVPGVQSALWFDQQDNLTRRIGELRAPRDPAQGPDLWLRAHAATATLGGGSTDMRRSDADFWGAELGFDHTWQTDSSARVTLGLFAAIGNMTQDFRDIPAAGSASGDSKLIGAGAYAAWLSDTGWFANAILSANYYKNTFDAADTSGNHTTGDYSDTGIGATIEAGYRIDLARGWFLEPSAQGAITHIARGDYKTGGLTAAGQPSTPISVHGTDATITRLRATLRAGRVWQTERIGWLQLAARAGATRERSTRGDITIGSADRWRPNLDGNRYEAGLGLHWQPPARSGQIYLDYEYAAGDNYNKPWSITLGFRIFFR